MQATEDSRINPLTHNDLYISRTTPLTSKSILYIYSTNIGTEYFKHALYSPFFLSLSSKCSLFHNANLFGSCIIHILYTECAKIKKKKFRRQRVKLQSKINLRVHYIRVTNLKLFQDFSSFYLPSKKKKHTF